MNKRDRLLIVVLFFALGSAMVTSMDSFSYTFKSIFFGIALTVFVAISLLRLYKYLIRVRK